MSLTTYKVFAPLRCTMVFHVEAPKGSTHNEICNLVRREDLQDAELIEEWDDVKNSWNEDWYLDSVRPHDLVFIQDDWGIQVELTE